MTRRSEDKNRAIAEGLQEWRESQIDGTLVNNYRERMGHIKTIPFDEAMKPSLIDRLSGYIIAAGVILLMGGSIWAVWRFV